MKEIRVVGVFIECGDEILLLHRVNEGSQGNLWALPAGKVERGESEVDAMVRELEEETGLRVNSSKLKLVDFFEWVFSDKKVIFVTFKLFLKEKFEVKLDLLEHKDYVWLKPEACYKKNNLIHGFHDLLEKVYGIKKLDS